MTWQQVLTPRISIRIVLYKASQSTRTAVLQLSRLGVLGWTDTRIVLLYSTIVYILPVVYAPYTGSIYTSSNSIGSVFLVGGWPVVGRFMG